MKTRSHHNNDGHRGIKTGSYSKKLAALAKKLNVPFSIGKNSPPTKKSKKS